MVKSSRSQLRDWFGQPLGQLISELEQSFLAEHLANVFGYHILQIGSLGWNADFLSASRIRHHVLIEWDDQRDANGIGLVARPGELPICSDSVDVVVLPHTLEFEDNPHRILRESERILIPEGRLVVLTFNAWSLWGIWRALRPHRKSVPWNGHFLSQGRLRDWLSLLGLEIESTHGLFYRPPLHNWTLMRKLLFLELLGEHAWPVFSAVRITVAMKRVSTLTPIKPRWRPRRSLRAAGLAEPSARLISL